jgi:hypothetical protein
MSDSESGQHEQHSSYEDPSGTDEQKQDIEQQQPKHEDIEQQQPKHENAEQQQPKHEDPVPLVVETQPASGDVQLEVLKPIENGKEEVKVVDASDNVIAHIERMVCDCCCIVLYCIVLYCIIALHCIAIALFCDCIVLRLLLYCIR